MAGLDPAIHVFTLRQESKTWITGSSPVMTMISHFSNNEKENA
jgi:hypothetical protein